MVGDWGKIVGASGIGLNRLEVEVEKEPDLTTRFPSGGRSSKPFSVTSFATMSLVSGTLADALLGLPNMQSRHIVRDNLIL